MKKLIFISIFTLALLSCSKDEQPEIITSYQITNNMPVLNTGYVDLDGSMWDVVVFHFSGDDIIGQDEFDRIAPGGSVSPETVVDNMVDKIKISFKLAGPNSEMYESELNVRKYIVAYKLIQTGELNTVSLEEETMLSNYMKGTAGIWVKNILVF